MKATIKTISPSGYEVSFEVEHEARETLIKAMPHFEAELTAAGYLPNATREWPKTPTGEPICPKHGVPMKKREKQGDIWYSHQVAAPDGSEHYCRGYADKSSTGWEY